MSGPCSLLARWKLVRSTALPALAAAALSAAAGCRSAPPEPAPISPETWAVVDGETITREEVDKAFRRIVDNSQAMSEDEALTAKLSLMDDLIMEEILLARARQLTIEVPESELDTAFAEARKDIPEEAFQQELTRRNLTAADMRDGLRRQLLTQKVIDQEVGSKIAIGDQEVTDFFNANREQFNLPEDAFHLAQIVVTPTRDPQVANRTGDDASTPQAAAAKVAMVMKRLEEGATFRDVAMDYSEDPESAARGGDLGLVPLSAIKQSPPALRDAALQLEPGRARVVTQNGIHTIVFVVAREPAGQRDLSTPGVRDRIRDTLRGRREQLLRTAYLAAARSDAAVTNHQARRVVDAQIKSSAPVPAASK